MTEQEKTKNQLAFGDRVQLARLQLQLEREQERARKQRKQDRADAVAMFIGGAVAIVSALLPLLFMFLFFGKH